MILQVAVYFALQGSCISLFLNGHLAFEFHFQSELPSRQLYVSWRKLGRRFEETQTYFAWKHWQVKIGVRGRLYVFHYCYCFYFGLSPFPVKCQMKVYIEICLTKNVCRYPGGDYYWEAGTPKLFLFSRWFKVTFLSPGWRSLNLSKGHLIIPKRSQRIARILCFVYPG